MKKFYYLLFAIFTNCALNLIPNPVGPTHGLLFTRNQFPGEFNPANDVKYEKKAEGCMYQVLYIIVWGDASAGNTAFNNGIKKIAAIDHRTANVLGSISSYCTIVYGE